MRLCCAVCRRRASGMAATFAFLSNATLDLAATEWKHPRPPSHLRVTHHVCRISSLKVSRFFQILRLAHVNSLHVPSNYSARPEFPCQCSPEVGRRRLGRLPITP